jgi:hypothetical protein
VSKAKPPETTKPSPSTDKAPEIPGVSICQDEGVFNCTSNGVVMNGNGHARMYSALDGIKTLTSILFQRELDRDCDVGIIIDQNIAIGLLNALGSCAELANYLMDGQGGHSRAIGDHEPDYTALQSLVTGRPG